MKPATLIFTVFLLATASLTWLIYEGYQTSIAKAQIAKEQAAIAADAKKFKAHEGNRFSFGILKKGD